MTKNMTETINYIDEIAAILNDYKLISSTQYNNAGKCFTLDNLSKIDPEVKLRIHVYEDGDCEFSAVLFQKIPKYEISHILEVLNRLNRETRFVSLTLGPPYNCIKASYSALFRGPREDLRHMLMHTLRQFLETIDPAISIIREELCMDLPEADPDGIQLFRIDLFEAE